MEGAQPPFGPIYNLLQDKLVVLHEYFDEGTLIRGSFNTQINLQPMPLSSLLRRKIFVNVCWLSWTKSTNHQELVLFALHVKVVGPS
jgi:hypothetical protein